MGDNTILLAKVPLPLDELSGTHHHVLEEEGGDEFDRDRIRVDYTEIEGTPYFRVDVVALGKRLSGKKRTIVIEPSTCWPGFAPIEAEHRRLGATFWNVPCRPHEVHVYVHHD